MSPLEARYRRLLACYPRDHRARHEEEMLGVLQATARPGQTRPDLADAADLLRGAARMHARRALGAVSAAAWRDGLAVAVALWPLVMLAAQAATVLLRVAQSLYSGWAPWEAPWDAPRSILFLTGPALIMALPALAVLLGRPWIAVLAMVAFALHQAVGYGVPPELDLENLSLPYWGALPWTAQVWAALVALVVAVLPMAHRGIGLIPRGAFLPWGTLALVGLIAGRGIALLEQRDVEVYRDLEVWVPIPWLVVVGLAAGYACRSAVGRWAALLLFLPAAAVGGLGTVGWIGTVSSVPTSTALAWLASAALAFTTAAVLTRRRSGQLRVPAS